MKIRKQGLQVNKRAKDRFLRNITEAWRQDRIENKEEIISVLISFWIRAQISNIPVFLMTAFAFSLETGKTWIFHTTLQKIEILFLTSTVFRSTCRTCISKCSVLESVVQWLRALVPSQNSAFKSQFCYLFTWVPGKVIQFIAWNFLQLQNEDIECCMKHEALYLVLCKH